MSACFFCSVYKELSAIAGGVLYEDDLVYAYHHCNEGEPSYLGYLLLNTKRHVPNFAELTEAEGQALGLGIARLSKALQACTAAEKVYVEAYYEVTPHLHLHMIARYPGTPEQYWRWKVTEWPAAPKGSPEEIAALCERLRVQLAQNKC